MLLTIDQAVETLRLGAIIAYPTEGVYGLGVDAQNRSAVLTLLALKKRSIEKGLIVVVDSLETIAHWILPLSLQEQERVLSVNSDGVRNTWLLPTRQGCPYYLTGGRNTLAVRISNHTVLQSLCRAFGGPIVSTSANIAGATILANPEAIISQFKGSIGGVLKGELGGLSKPTTIMSLKSNEVVRH